MVRFERFRYVFFLLIFFMVPVHAVIVVIRHGQSTHNVQEYYNSNPDHQNYRPSFLTQDGINDLIVSCKQLLALGINKENVKVAYVSPLPRTIQTAGVLTQMGILSHDALRIDKRLIEVQMGSREGRYYADFPGDPWDLSPENTRLYQGESEHDVAYRVGQLLQEIKESAQSGAILLITHGGPAEQLMILMGQEGIELPPAGFKIIE